MTRLLYLAVCALSLGLALPKLFATQALYPDAVEYLGIAWSWVSGAGFVDPVIYSYYLPDTLPPAPALVMRAPLLPALLALPLALGASLHTLLVLHAIAAAAAGAAGVFVASRIGGVAAAAAFGIGFGASYPWLFALQMPLTEAASIGMLLAIAAAAPRALASPRAALGFGVIVALAWATRPNLALAAPAFAAAAVVVLGPRRALRSAPLWIALASFVALQQGVSLACRATTGLAPYAHYGVLLETTAAREAAFFQKEWIGWLAWVGQNEAKVRAVLAANAQATLRLLFTAPDYHYVGWITVPALLDAWRRRDAERPRRVLLAILGLALLAVQLVSWGAIDPRRLLLPAALCFWLLAAGWLAQVARSVAAPGLAKLLPALAVAAVWLLSPSAAGTFGAARSAWRAARDTGLRSGLEDSFAPALCASLDRDGIVASPQPWDVYLACGNAGWWIAPDVDEPDVLDRYLARTAARHLIVPVARASRLDASPRLERGPTAAGHVLFTVRDAPQRSRPWRAPPPLLGDAVKPAPARTP